MGRAQREKGNRGEREAAAELAAVFTAATGRNVTGRRGVQYQGGQGSPDVVLDLPIHVEAKRTERLSLWAAVDQAKADAGDHVPIVWHRCNRRGSVVVIETARLADLLRVVADHRGAS